MGKYSLAESKKTDKQLLKMFDEQHDIIKYPDLRLIFEICLADRNKFIEIPGISDEQSYIKRWVNKYVKEHNDSPSNHIAKPKDSCNDPALSIIVEASGFVDSIEEAEKAHILFMSAENIQGKLLEQYISFEISKFGFIWCQGSVMRAADFCNTDGTCIIQIKNKNNTENSSSSAIREGTSIKHWFRLSTSKAGNKRFPVYHWAELNKIIEDNKTKCKDENCQMSEEKYQTFIRGVVASNNKIICSE